MRRLPRAAGRPVGRRRAAPEGRHAAGRDANDLEALQQALGLPAIHAAQPGLLSDMDFIADVLYGRAAG